MDNFKDENRSLKQSNSIFSKETDELKRDAEKLERRIELLARFEDECHRLQEEKSTLIKESSALQEQFESVIMEKEDLEYQNQKVIESLHEEREAKSLLEMRIKEDSYHIPAHPSWAEDQKRFVDESYEERKDDSASLDHVQREKSVPSPIHIAENLPIKLHSTPYPANKAPQNLLSELQDSITLDVDKDEIENLRRKLTEMEEEVNMLTREKKVLEGNITASSLRETEQVKELESFKDKYAKAVCEKDVVIEELNQKIIIRDEQIEQLRSKLTTATAERTSMEIEVDGLNNEIQRLKVISGVEMDKIQREFVQEQSKGLELKSQITVLEEEMAGYVSSIEKLESILINSHSELGSMTDDLKSLQKVMATLSVDGKLPSTGPKNKQMLIMQVEGDGVAIFKEEKDEDAPVLSNGGTGEEPYYSLDLKLKKSSVQVHNENHSLRAIVALREHLRSIRSPLEQFTKVMLERSLAHSSKRTSPLPSSPDIVGTAKKNTLDLEASISKWKSKYMHKTEEISNLRSIMKARATTAEVATSSLRSKLQGQARAYQTELTKLKYQIKMLKKERDEHLSLRTMYAKRCEEYIDEITKVKKTAEKQKQERDDLMVSLKKTIQKKLELSTELEEYKMEQERKVLIPQFLNSSMV